MRLAVLASTALLAVLLVAPAARADAPLWSGPPGAAAPPMAPAWAPWPPPPLPRVQREVSYAHQTLIVDGIAAVFFLGAARQQDAMVALPLIMMGVDVYALGAPIVHFANRRFMAGVKSFGLRIGLPLLGASIGGKLAPREQTLCEPGAYCDSGSSTGVALGALLGATAAVILDAKYLAKKRVSVEVVPMLQASPQGFSAGIGGAF